MALLQTFQNYETRARRETDTARKEKRGRASGGDVRLLGVDRGHSKSS